MYIEVSPFFKSFDVAWLTYHVPGFLEWEIKDWIIVEIPFKENIDLWLVIKILDKIEVDDSKIKSIISVYNKNFFLNNYRKNLLPWISDYYYTPIHNSNNLFFPKNLIEKIKKQKYDINKTSEIKYNYNHDVDLSEDQEKCYKEIKESDNNKILFHWITWSWKTEIYIKLIKDNLDNNTQSLLLIPEIILTNQISEKIKQVFWDNVLIINSTITDATKTKYWTLINNNNAKIIIWTRSALFYPYNNLWLIIIDEEHDNSYISDKSPRYNAIEVAEKITNLNWNKLVLASWTPSINSMYKWVKKEFKLVSLLKKYS